MTERPDPHMWPEVTRAQLLAGLTATGKADEADRFARLLAQGETCEECETAGKNCVLHEDGAA